MDKEDFNLKSAISNIIIFITAPEEYKKPSAVSRWRCHFRTRHHETNLARIPNESKRHLTLMEDDLACLRIIPCPSDFMLWDVRGQFMGQGRG